MDIAKSTRNVEPYIIEIRRWFHQHPELSKKELKTSEKICDELNKMGIPHEQIGPNHNIIATISGKHPGKTLMIRADMDALPIKEETGLPFSSQNDGVMHACGHDAHVSMLLGAAKILNQYRSQLKGTVKLAFQSAEEIGEGVDEIIEYLKNREEADCIIGLHVSPDLPSGEILLLPGASFAGSKNFTCHITGVGGHGAQPNKTKDPIKAACDLVSKMAMIPANFHDVMDYCAVSTTSIHAGNESMNIIPSEAITLGTMRYYKKDGDLELLDAVKHITKGIETIYGVKIEVNPTKGLCPVINDSSMIDIARKVAPETDGLKVSSRTKPIAGSDNFAILLREHKGFYGALGCKTDDHPYSLHHCKFNLDESVMRKGTEFMVRFADFFLNSY